MFMILACPALTWFITKLLPINPAPPVTSIVFIVQVKWLYALGRHSYNFYEYRWLFLGLQPNQEDRLAPNYKYANSEKE